MSNYTLLPRADGPRYFPKVLFVLLFFLTLGLKVELSAQMTAWQLDRIASRILTVNHINLIGEIRVNRTAAQGLAATMGNRGYSIIYVDPYYMRTLSQNTWAFILGHELAHQYLGHRQSNVQNEFEADRQGVIWVSRAGYDVNAYLQYMASQPDFCSISHGCWHDRIRNIMNMYGLAYRESCN